MRYINTIFFSHEFYFSLKVDVLDVHGEEGHQIAVEKGQEKEKAEEVEIRMVTGEERRTQLTAYFEFNRFNPEMGLTYVNCYKQLRYVQRPKIWQLRKTAPRRKICRLKGVSPSNFELLVIHSLIFVFIFFLFLRLSGYYYLT